MIQVKVYTSQDLLSKGKHTYCRIVSNHQDVKWDFRDVVKVLRVLYGSKAIIVLEDYPD